MLQNNPPEEARTDVRIEGVLQRTVIGEIATEEAVSIYVRGLTPRELANLKAYINYYNIEVNPTTLVLWLSVKAMRLKLLNRWNSVFNEDFDEAHEDLVALIVTGDTEEVLWLTALSGTKPIHTVHSVILQEIPYEKT